MQLKYEWDDAEPFLVGALFFVNDRDGLACWFDFKRVTGVGAWSDESLKEGSNVLVIDRDGHKLRVLSGLGLVWVSEFMMLQTSTRQDK